MLVAWACMFLSVTALADTLVVTGVNNNFGENTYLTETGVDTATYAGEGDIELDGTTARTAFCVAIFVDILIGQTYNTSLEDIAAVNNGGRVGWLLDDELPQLPISGSGVLGTAAQQGAGLQMAIWDIVNDNGDGFSSGNIQAASNTDPTALADAQLFEAASLGKSADAWVYYNTDPTTGAVAQTLMGFVALTDGGPIEATPEPSTFGVVSLGLVMAGLALRRQRSPAAVRIANCK